MLDVLERAHPGMHTTDTVDFDVVVPGEVYLELDRRPVDEILETPGLTPDEQIAILGRNAGELLKLE